MSQNSFELGHNKFSTWTNDEYKSMFKLQVSPDTTEYAHFEGDTKPLDGIDWRAQGAVNPIKNEEGCKSDYVFSAVASVEGFNFIQNKELLNLSE